MARAVFFDLDGTLADTQRDLVAAVNHTRADCGLQPWPQAAVIANVGCGARYLLERSIPERSDFESVYLTFKQHYAEHATETVTLYPGVRETLEALREQGWRLGVNTNKPRFATLKILRHFELEDFFGDAVVAGGDCAEMKPSAEPLRECARRLGDHALSSDDWMVGDSWTDLKCATAAGVKGCFCSFGFGRLNDAAYAARIDSFSDLPAVLI